MFIARESRCSWPCVLLLKVARFSGHQQYHATLIMKLCMSTDHGSEDVCFQVDTSHNMFSYTSRHPPLSKRSFHPLLHSLVLSSLSHETSHVHSSSSSSSSSPNLEQHTIHLQDSLHLPRQVHLQHILPFPNLAQLRHRAPPH